MITDPIADLLIRIKNGYLARRESVVVPHSNVKESLLKVLQKYGYVDNLVHEKEQRILKVTLIYKQGTPALTEVKRLSKPGLRRYIRARDLGTLRQGLGYIILSTPQGLKTHHEAKAAKIGGELLCAIW